MDSAKDSAPVPAPPRQAPLTCLCSQILKRGCHVNDRDGLTDMTLLHYSCKAGAHGMGKSGRPLAPPRAGANLAPAPLPGDPAAALRLSSQLISLGADVSLRSRWTNMNALHYAAYFDVPELIRVLLKAAKPRGAKAQRARVQNARVPDPALSSSVLNSTCGDFHYGTALHIAASNLCLGAVKCLLEHGADPSVRVRAPTGTQAGRRPGPGVYALVPAERSGPGSGRRGP